MDWGSGEEGGFMNSSIAEEPQQLASSISVGGDDKNKSIAAVSISQISKFTRPNEGLVLHNKKVYHLNLVAFVYEILDINSTKIHLLVDDYSNGGPLEVTHIIGDTGIPSDDNDYSMFSDNAQSPEGDQPRSLNSIKVGDYIRCIGVVKFNQDKSNFVAYNLRIIEDPNEVTMHTLEVIRDSMFYERLQSGTVSVVTSTKEIQKSVGVSDMDSRSNNFGNLSTRDKHLLKFLREKNIETGMSLNDIVDNFKAFSRRDIEESLTTLSSEGLCWQGDSEDLWCVNPTD